MMSYIIWTIETMKNADSKHFADTKNAIAVQYIIWVVFLLYNYRVCGDL